jgi:hypothetical protein
MLLEPTFRIEMQAGQNYKKAMLTSVLMLSPLVLSMIFALVIIGRKIKKEPPIINAAAKGKSKAPADPAIVGPKPKPARVHGKKRRF